MDFVANIYSFPHVTDKIHTILKRKRVNDIADLSNDDEYVKNAKIRIFPK